MELISVFLNVLWGCGVRYFARFRRFNQRFHNEPIHEHKRAAVYSDVDNLMMEPLTFLCQGIMNMGGKIMQTRRTFIANLVGCVLTLGIQGVATAQSSKISIPEGSKGAETGSSQPPWILIDPLRVGDDLGFGWTVVELSGLMAGSIVATLAHISGRAQRIRIRIRDGKLSGIVGTTHFDLQIINNGAGSSPTDEGLAQAVAQLGRTIQQNEAECFKDGSLVVPGDEAMA